MSSQKKDPVEKQDPPSESGESHSDGEVEEAEENLEHLKIKPKEEAKDDTDELKSLDFPIQEGPPPSPESQHSESASSSGRRDPRKIKSEPAGSSGLGDPRLTHSERAFKDLKKGFEEMLDSPDHAFFQSLEDKPASAGPSKRYFEPKKRDLPPHYYEGLPSNLETLAYKRMSFARGRDNTSSDVSEIHSEVADLPPEDHEVSEAVVKETSPSDDIPAVERQSSEASDKNVDMPEEYSAPLPTPSGSDVSISTNTAEQGHRAYLARLQREADARGVPVSTSSGIGSTNQSELANLQRWGDVGYYRPNLEDIPDSPNRDVSELGAQFGEPQPEAGCMQVEQSSEIQRKQDCGGLFQQEQQKEESNTVENVARKMEAEGKVETSNVQEASPSVGRKRSKRVSYSDSEEIVAAKLRPRVKPDDLRKSKIAASKSGATSQSSSDSPDPKSSSSDELRSKDSPDIKSSSPSQSDGGKKSWQKFGQLRSMQLSTVVSKDSVITEEEEGQLSPRRALNPELMSTSREKVKAIPEKNVEGATGTKQTELKSSLESGDQACASQAVATSKEHESSFEVSEFERSVGPTKRPGGKLSTSPPSDETLSSTPPKEATSRPKKKKARADKKYKKTTRRTRHDSGGSAQRSASRERLQRDDSASTSTPDVSDYSGSDKDEEEETAL